MASWASNILPRISYRPLYNHITNREFLCLEYPNDAAIGASHSVLKKHFKVMSAESTDSIDQLDVRARKNHLFQNETENEFFKVND